MNIFKSRIITFSLFLSIMISTFLVLPIDKTDFTAEQITTEITTTEKQEKNNVEEKIEKEEKENKETSTAVVSNETKTSEKETKKVTTTQTTTTKPQTIKEEKTEEKKEQGMLSSCKMTEKEFENKLCKSLKEYSSYFLEAEKTYGVNAAFLAAVAALESGWGESYMAKNYNNFFGWRSSSGYVKFDSPRDCIMTIAKKLKENYLSPNGCHFNGYTISAINIRYNGSAHWENQVTKIYNDIMY